MATRRQIREAAIQFLYSADLEGGEDPTPLREPFWHIITESDRRPLCIATWKALRHLQLSRDSRYEIFLSRLPSALALLESHPDFHSQFKLLQHIAKLESDWEKTISDTAKISLKLEASVLLPQLEEKLDELFEINGLLLRERAEFSRILQDFPSYRPQLEPIVGSLSRLDRISRRIATLADPESYPDIPELQKIRQSTASLRELRNGADALIDAVLANKKKLDKVLNGVIENYSPERIDPIDRAILRLATWEICEVSDIPVAVSINEAIELARKYGTSASPRFVNGVLDKVAKSIDIKE